MTALYRQRSKTQNRMSHRLQERIATTTRKAWTYSLLWGICVAASGIVLLIAAGGSLDYLLRLEDQGLRLLLTGAVLSGVGWLTWRYGLKRFKAQVSKQAVAERLERQYPTLDGQLTSALEFLDQEEDDPHAGSSVLRRAVISRTDVAADEIDFSSVLRKRPLVQALSTALIIVLVAGAFCFWQPEAARTALVRLGNPLSSVTWPRASYLEWKEAVQHVPRGGTFEVEVIDAHGMELPERVDLQFRYRGAEDDIETLPMRFVGDRLRFRREGVVRPFEYRAVGGDDATMAWTALEVIEPPEVESLELEFHPPAYTGWPLRKSDGRVEALVGTYIALHGTSTKKLQSAEVVVDDERIAASVGPDGFTFSVAVPSEATSESVIATEQLSSPDALDVDGAASARYFVVKTSGAYSLELVDENGYESADQTQYEIRAVTDDAPRVNIDDPAADLVATTNGRLPLVVSAADDLLLQDVELRYARSDQSDQGNLAIPLYQRKDPPPLLEDWPAWTTPDEARVVEFLWDLRDLRLPPGARLTFYAVAEDFAGQVGQSPTRRLTIVTPEQLQERLAEEQAFVVDELARVLETQVAARNHIAGIQLQLRDVGKITPDDVDTLQTAELTQHNVDRALLGESTGVRGHVQRMLQMIENNRLDTPDVARRMQDILDTVTDISQHELPAITAALTAAVKDAQFSDEDQAESPLAENLQTAAARQNQVVQKLEAELGKLSQWNNYRRFFRDVGRIRQDQATMAQDVAGLTAELLGKRADELNTQERADLAKLQSRHGDLARRLETLQGQMQPMIETLQESDPLAADTLADALALAQQQAIGQQLRQAGAQVQQNQLASAMRSHEQIGEVLQEMLDVLANKREHELARLAKKLEQAAADLQSLPERQ